MSRRDQIRDRVEREDVSTVSASFVDELVDEYPEADRWHLRRDARVVIDEFFQDQFDTKTHLHLSDLHVPYTLWDAFDGVLKWIEEHRPDRIVINGDLLDMDMISRFGSEPGTPTIHEERELAIGRVIEPIERAAPAGATLHMTEGNHEERMGRFLSENPGLYDLPELTVPSMLGLDERGWTWNDYMDPLKLDGVTYVHGNRVSKHAAYAAKRHSADLRYDRIVHGHTHRMGLYSHQVDAVVWAAEAGGLFDESKLKYVECPNWQPGFAVVTAAPSHNYWDVDLVRVNEDDQTFCYGGRWYGP